MLRVPPVTQREWKENRSVFTGTELSLSLKIHFNVTKEQRSPFLILKIGILIFPRRENQDITFLFITEKYF